MKLNRIFLLLLSATLILSSCGESDDNNNGGTGGKTDMTNNTNSNHNDVNPYTHRLEFPHVKGGKSLIIVHTLSSGEVNYSVEWDTDLKSNRWTCYQINGSNRKTNTKRYYSDENQYPQDPLLPSQYQWTTDPFWRSGFDHGHLCPSADRLNTTEANIQTFYMTNMMPQLNSFNANVWATMESWVRSQIKAGDNIKDTLYVVKGGTIDHQNQIMTNKVHGMIIPLYYYMAVLMKNSGGYKAMGFWIKHEANTTTNLAPYVVNIRTLEQNTGIDFFCNLPDDTESHVENLPIENVKRAWGFNQ
jgi:endonuclease G